MTDYKVRITVKGIGLEIIITSSDTENMVLMAGAIIDSLRKNNMEPTVEFIFEDMPPLKVNP